MSSAEQQIAEHHAAAQNALRDGLLREVHQRCLAILKIDPSFADAWFICAVIAAHNGQIAKAIDILAKSIELAPGNPEYRTELGKQLIALDEPERALEEANTALTLNPNRLTTLNTLGAVFSHTGEHEKALRCFDKAANLLQERTRGTEGLTVEWLSNLHFNRGASQQFAGRIAEAEKSYDKAVQLQPKMFKAHSALSTVRRYTAQDNHLSRLEKLRGEIANPHDQLHIGHAIAKELEDMGRYQESLASLIWAKQGQAAIANYSAESDSHYFAGIMHLFTPERLNATRSGCDSQEPIFIVGMPRTGTTLVEQILSSHSQVYAAGELRNFPSQVKRATGAASGDLLDIQTLRESLGLNLETLGSAYIDSTRPRTGHTPRFIDKLPLNFLLLGLIKQALPNARLICLRRDPMDTCLSNFRQLFAVDFKPYHYNYDLLDCGRYFILFDQLMRHWQRAMPGAVHEVSYEALVANPEQVSRELLTHCGLAWEDQCLSFHQRKTSVATPSAAQVKQQVYTSSVNRWQRYGDAMQPLYALLESAGYYR